MPCCSHTLILSLNYYVLCYSITIAFITCIILKDTGDVVHVLKCYMYFDEGTQGTSKLLQYSIHLNELVYTGIISNALPKNFHELPTQFSVFLEKQVFLVLGYQTC